MDNQQSSIPEQRMMRERRITSLYVQQTGRQQCPPNYRWGPGVRNHFLLHHVVAGRGIFITRGKEYHLQAGDTFLSYPDTTVQYYADTVQPWEYLWVGFGGVDAALYMEQTDLSPEEPVYTGRDSQQLQEMIEEICQGYGPSLAEELTTTSRLYALLAFLVSTAHGSRSQPRPQWQEATDCALLVAEYITNHYEAPITVDGLAEYAAVSHSSLYRSFKRRFQMSPKRFLLEYRIERACILLATTNYSIQEISNSVGFEDPFYFSRAFKEIKGISPRQYANQLQSSGCAKSDS